MQRSAIQEPFRLLQTPRIPAFGLHPGYLACQPNVARMQRSAIRDPFGLLQTPRIPAFGLHPGDLAFHKTTHIRPC